MNRESIRLVIFDFYASYLWSQFQNAFHNGKEVLNRPWHVLKL
jgi:hypothetical protein